MGGYFSTGKPQDEQPAEIATGAAQPDSTDGSGDTEWSLAGNCATGDERPVAEDADASGPVAKLGSIEDAIVEGCGIPLAQGQDPGYFSEGTLELSGETGAPAVESEHPKRAKKRRRNKRKRPVMLRSTLCTLSKAA